MSYARAYRESLRVRLGDPYRTMLGHFRHEDITPLESDTGAPIERLLFDWNWISLFLDRVNTAMGKNPLCPFDISEAVADKLVFAHTVVRHTADRYSTQ